MSEEEGETKKASYKKIPLSIVTVALSGLVVFTATTYYTDIYKQPSIDIGMKTTHLSINM